MAINQAALVGGIAVGVFVFLFGGLYAYCTNRHKKNPKPTHHFVGKDIALGGLDGTRVRNPLPPSYSSRSNGRRKGGYADLEAQHPTYPPGQGFQEYALPPLDANQGPPQRLTLPQASPPPRYLPQQPAAVHHSSHVHGSRGPASSSHLSTSGYGSTRTPQSHHSSRLTGSSRSTGGSRGYPPPPPLPPLPPAPPAPPGTLYSAIAHSRGGVSQPASERMTPSPYASSGSAIGPSRVGTRR